jgi:hypothetical protein
MTVDDGDQPDPERQRLARSIFVPSSLGQVAEAVSVATEHETRIYVERLGDAYRWSLTHRGGPYPLLRITARFLRIDYHRIVVGARAVADGVVVVCGDRETDTEPDAWSVIKFDGPAQPANVAERIALVLAPK